MIPDDIECLVCKRKMRFLGTHIKRVHGMTAAEYRQEYDLPASFALASPSYCEQARRRTTERIALGAMTYEHLPRAVEEARNHGRGYIATSIKQIRSETAKKTRPGDARLLPPGARRKDGRDADKARKAQQKRREKKLTQSHSP